MCLKEPTKYNVFESKMTESVGTVSNPDAHSFMLEYVRNMNNEIFLSEHQLNGLYALLLINRPSVWDQVLY